MDNPSEDFLPGFPTVDQFSQANLRKILMATKFSNELPADKKSDWDYYTTFPGFRQVMNAQGDKIRTLIKSQLDYHNIKAKCDSNDISDLVDVLCDANDALMEKININLDEASGLKKAADPLLLEVSQSRSSLISGSWNKQKNHNRESSSDPSNLKLLAAKNVLRPQVRFKHLIDNSPKNPFIPRLTEKPHSIKPLSILVEYDEQGQEYYSHPYLFEIERFTPSPDQLRISLAVKPKSVEETELVYIDTLPALRIAIHELSLQDIIGIDVEHHSYRSYQGITCLIQISTQNKDFLIDPFHIWADLTILNEVTANPKIVKVLHGCDKDVEWLQRDFSVYLVNVFDSHQAAKLLGLPRLSLAALLHHYCGLAVDKQFQLADWRIRPLPEEMVYYARQDTRYLLYLYARIKNELISRGNEQNNLLHSAFTHSNNLCKKMYKKQVVWDDSHLHLIRKSKISFNNKQQFALKEIYNWRDKVSREEDESPGFVLPNHMLLKICSELPREMQGILACCNPVPPMVKQNLQALHVMILAAREKQLATVVTLEGDSSQETNAAKAQVGGIEFLENPLSSPLDLGNMADCKTQLETVLGGQISHSVNNNIVKDRPDLLVFAENDKDVDIGVSKEFTSPYGRYKLLQPYLDSMAKEEKDGPRTKQDRMNSIKDHFQKLTDMTQVKKEVAPAPEDEEVVQEEVTVESSSEDEDENLPVKSIRGDFKDEFKKHKKARKSQASREDLVKFGGDNGSNQGKKRKSMEQADEDSKIPKMDKGDPSNFDYNNVDFNALNKGANKQRKHNDDFNPNKQHDKGRKGGKQKAQKYRGGGQSCTFKGKSNK